MKCNLFTNIALLLLSFGAQCQTLFWQDNLENATTTTLGGGVRTPSTTFLAGVSRYFSRVSTANISTGTTYTGYEGTYFWGGEDIDYLTTQGSQSFRQNVTWSSIGISGRNNLSFKGLFAIGTTTTFDHGTVTSGTDHLVVEYRIDGGVWKESLRFFPNIVNSTSGALALETTGDSLGDGPALSAAFAEHTFNITGTGTNLEIRARFSSSGSTEEIAIDNFRVYETAATPSILVSGTIAPLEACLGTASLPRSFVVSGANLSNNLVITAPTGYQVSVPGSGIYAATASLTPVNGVVSAKDILLRLSETATVGAHVGPVTITSTGAEAKSINVVGTVYPLQDPNASATAFSPICSGSQSSVSISGTAGVTYTVKDQNGNILGSAKALNTGALSITTVPLTAINSNTIYTLTIVASVPTCSDVVLNVKPSIVVGPVQSPQSAVTATSPICFGTASTVTIAATVGVTYTLTDKEGNVLGGKKATVQGDLVLTTPIYNAAGIDTLSIVASVVGCPTVSLIAQPKVVVLDSIHTEVTVSGAQLTAQEVNATYQWKLCNGNDIGNATGASYTALNNGSYQVTITKGGCSKSSACIPVVVTDLEDAAVGQASVFPNPSEGSVVVQGNAESQYTLRDELGRVLKAINLNASNQYSVTLSGLQEGVYILSGSNNGKSITQKIVVIK